MSSNILLDVGTDTIKALEVKTGPFLKRPVIAGAAITRNTESGTRAVSKVASVVIDMLNKNHLSSRNLIVEMNGNIRYLDVSMRNIQGKKFWKALNIDLKASVSIDPKEMNVQFIPLEATNDTITGKVLTMPKHDVEEMKRRMKPLGLHLAHIGYAPLDLARLYGDAAPGEDILIVDIGAAVTNVAILHGNLPYHLGSIPWGMGMVDERLRTEFSLDSDKATDFRKRIGLASQVQSFTKIALVIRSEINKFIQLLRDETYPTIANIGGHVQALAVTGGASRMTGIPELIMEAIGADRMVTADTTGTFDYDDPALAKLDHTYYATLLGAAKGLE
jgi:Tfp pilus assembly PilM family ATPase